jgi:hypothetical protein
METDARPCSGLRALWALGLLLLTACRAAPSADRTVDRSAAPGADRSASAASSAAATRGLRPIVIRDPLDRWRREGFVEMAPTIRVSIATGGGAETRVFLRLPEGARVTTGGARGPGLLFPPGTESDRVSYVLAPGGQARWIDDVRGTRWGDDGTEYFHVYLPRDEREGSPLVGVEWRRDDPEQERQATDWLVDWVRTHRSPTDGDTMSEAQAARFRRLNHCQWCHVADKPEATSATDRLPPWPTDGRGLYSPLAVLSPHAVLSNTPSFDDPNARDPFVKTRCPDGATHLEGRPGYHWFSCPSGVPHGERDLLAAMQAADDYAGRTCQARRYLVSHMDDPARALYAPTLQPCAGP